MLKEKQREAILKREQKKLEVQMAKEEAKKKREQEVV